MTKIRRRALNWILTGTALLMAMSTACAQEWNRPAPVPVQFRGPYEGVNRFGEFDGLLCDTSLRTSGASALQQHTFIDEGFDGDVAVSPDGNWLVFSSTRHNEKGDIYIQRVDGLSVTQITDDDASDAFPVFSPDGRKIAFCSTRAGNWDIYLMDPGGKDVVQVTSGPSHDMHPTFAADGSRLAYCSQNRAGQWELWVVDLRTNQKRMIGDGLFPSWSPDRSRDRIAFQRARSRGSRWFSLWTLDLVDGEGTNVTEVALSTNAAIVSPAWSPDGRKLAFATIVEPAKSRDERPIGQQDIWVINADGSNRRRLTDGYGSNAAPFWGADDRVYFISDRGGVECVWSASARSTIPPTMNARQDPAKADAPSGTVDARDGEH